MPEPQFSEHIDSNLVQIFLMFFSTFISLFILIVHLVRFNTSNKRNFLTYMLTRVSISTFLSFNLSMFTEENGTTINNENRKEFQISKNAKIYSILQP